MNCEHATGTVGTQLLVTAVRAGSVTGLVPWNLAARIAGAGACPYGQLKVLEWVGRSALCGLPASDSMNKVTTGRGTMLRVRHDWLLTRHPGALEVAGLRKKVGQKGVAC